MILIQGQLDPASAVLSQPLVVALVAAAVCGAGTLFLSEKNDGRTSVLVSKTKAMGPSTVRRYKREIVICVLNFSGTSLLVLPWTKSAILTFPFAIFSVVITWIYLRNKKRNRASEMMRVWPEVTDHLISAIHSGLSLSEALSGLGLRGPDIVRPDFCRFREELLESGDFTACAERLKSRFNTHGSDQILEAILLAKSLGGSELLQIFRTVGDFLRQDLALRKEIEIKHGWIRNSAHLSSAAPWLLLLLLSNQPGTAEAFSQPGGIAILLAGLILTCIAYLWMGQLGRLPNSPRVFGQQR